jgi:hypothetical protein
MTATATATAQSRRTRRTARLARVHTPERLALLDQLCQALAGHDLYLVADRARVSHSTLYRWTAGITRYGRLDKIVQVGAAIGWELRWHIDGNAVLRTRRRQH